MRCKPAGIRARSVLALAQQTVRDEQHWILHALYCERCDVRFEALALLALAGLDEDGFVDQVWSSIMGEGSHA